ncbi:hypothetical protein [Mesorhizobium sp. BH1-1-4]|uniref:hypothetical protein n=1 Tax=Mesorhizobium sp. BH1-1-4 TaxID=2876662 RepID=UPI001CD17D00|nr:hypothetical protein [Mesorhizobium sp. BH1-1-4]MBZ9992847.1 hypothetical protein [Mesorhizobium sp. BH1-1-4]
MHLEVNGKAFQNGSTATMVYGVRHLVSYRSAVHEPAPRRYHFHRHSARRGPPVRSRDLSQRLAMSLPWASRVLANRHSDRS